MKWHGEHFFEQRGGGLVGTAGNAGGPVSANEAGVKVEKDIVTGPATSSCTATYIVHRQARKSVWRSCICTAAASRVAASKCFRQRSRPSRRAATFRCGAYRLSGVAKWPAQADDVKVAMKWTRDNADRLGVDPKRIATVGYSAGGYLSLLAPGDRKTNWQPA
jgi:hypothetical protein